MPGRCVQIVCLWVSLALAAAAFVAPERPLFLVRGEADTAERAHPLPPGVVVHATRALAAGAGLVSGLALPPPSFAGPPPLAVIRLPHASAARAPLPLATRAGVAAARPPPPV